MRRGLALFGLTLGSLALGAMVLVLRATTAGWEPPTVDVQPLRPDVEAVAQVLGGYIRIDTQQPPGPDSWEDDVFHAGDTVVAQVLEESGERVEQRMADPNMRQVWPAWVRHLERAYLERLGLDWRMVEGALVVRVPGQREGAPVLMLSHVDTVPVDAADWTFPPLAGDVRDGHVWGRGALDNKASTIAQLEALSLMQAEGMVPSRSLVLAITPDEEVGGATAAWLAGHLGEIGSPDVVIDEGTFLLEDFMPGVVVAPIAVAEKTYMSYELRTTGEGGHASMPTGHSAADRMARALQRIADWQTPSALSPTMVRGLERIAPTQPGVTGLALANADVLGGIVRKAVQKTPAGNAVTRDTVAITMLEGGVKDNVLPTEVTATINVRMMPETDPTVFEAQLLEVIADPSVELVPLREPIMGGISSPDTETFHALEKAVVAVAPGTVVIPSYTPGTMDARHFGAAGLQTYRILPFLTDAELRRSMHGTDERLPLRELERAVGFYSVLFRVL